MKKELFVWNIYYTSFNIYVFGIRKSDITFVKEALSAERLYKQIIGENK